MVELVVDSECSILGRLESVEDEGLLVGTCGDELVVQWRGVDVIVVMVVMARWMLENRS